MSLDDERKYTGFNNAPISIDDDRILKHIQGLQRAGQIKPSDDLDGLPVGRQGGYNLTVEMETGVGKTYTYIKTMYELNKRFGWSKLIIDEPQSVEGAATKERLKEFAPLFSRRWTPVGRRTPASP